MSAIELMIQMGKNCQIIAMLLKRHQCRTRKVVFPRDLWEKVARIKPEVIANTNESPR